MKAVRVHGPGDLRVEERPDPVPGDGEVLVAMEWGGICPADVSYWKHGRSGSALLRHPLILGHEVAGTVIGLGRHAQCAQIGQAVTFHPATLVGDGTMPPRMAGRTNLYSQVRYFGSAALAPHTDGGFSQLKAVRADQVRPLPEHVSTLEGALAEPLAVAMHAVERAGSLIGRDVLINGCGPLGSLLVAAARNAGARTVLAADVSYPARRIARAMGADAVVDPRDDDLPQDVEVVFEASGDPGALASVLRAAARGGVVVQVGHLPDTPVPSALADLVNRELSWVGSYGFVDEIDDAIDAIAQGLDVQAVVGGAFGIDAAETALRAADDPTIGGKIMIRLN
ncbi:L-idonate 5-dehydrogenase [Xylanimonas ulmi]|uniref:L-idonate 5-dehydrogenase n=1 Tax=Xylanimonas ulmi TaxID=228973 RepID=A0A4Q7M2G2_9MICO|nr:L-idonate 5-dehydrogenase [Xylanibacterium ulmi]RZS61017.1 L-idonate 5-dehydrogenase [Xylanibacterium ulmi]